MTVYHQLGHDSENLLFEPDLAAYAGAILSPLNYGPERTLEQVTRVRARLPPEFELLFDPQLYVPQSDMGKLRTWSYYPTDVETADVSSLAWWSALNGRILQDAFHLGINGVCSPAFLPKADRYSDGYLSFVVQVGNDLVEQAGAKLAVCQTAVVSLKDLALPDHALHTASLLSATRAKSIYLVFVSDDSPRRELAKSDELEGAVVLVRELKKAGLHIVVGFCSADMVLWKAAGADSCASGKFFNLRRFTRSRWDEPSSGGQNIPYLFEESLLAFVREADIRRLHSRGLLSSETYKNPFGARILEKFERDPGTAWVADGWRQFLYWFHSCESRISAGLSVDELLESVEAAWEALPEAKVLLEEPKNNGAWIRPWRIAALAARG